MDSNAQKLLQDALLLPDNERAAIAASLIHSLDPVTEDQDEAWRIEIDRRLAELDSGAVTPVPWSEVRKRIGLTDDTSKA
jgi:putative addiction module component (TIGR02574 family)